MRDSVDRLKGFIFLERVYSSVTLVLALLETVLLLFITERLFHLAREPRGVAEQLTPEGGLKESEKKPDEGNGGKPADDQYEGKEKPIPFLPRRFKVRPIVNFIRNFRRRISVWISGHPILSIILTTLSLVALVSIIWLIINKNTWTVLPLAVGHTESETLDSEKITIQLISDLDQVGAGNPVPHLSFEEPQAPHTKSGSVLSLFSLPLEECDTVLQGPGDYIDYAPPITFPTLQTGSEDTRLNLGDLSIGNINVPSQLFLQFFRVVIPSSYREFSGHINESRGELEISVTSKQPLKTWRVAGRRETISEMLDYLAVRMTIDLNPQIIDASGHKKPPEDRELAFAMGTQAFREQRYQRALAFFEIDDQFAPLDSGADAMLSLTHYQESLAQSGEDATHLANALRVMEAAVREDPIGDRSPLRAYLVCLLDKSDQEARRDEQLAIFNKYLEEKASKDKSTRIAELKGLPQRGPGWRLAAVGNDLLYLDGEGNIRIRYLSSDSSSEVVYSGIPPARQIRYLKAAEGSELLFVVTEDGSVRSKPLFETNPNWNVLVLGLESGGIQQIDISTSSFQRINFVFLNRFGKIYWCGKAADLSDANSTCQLEKPLFSEQPINAAQISLVKDQLYILNADGAVWSTQLDENGNAGPAKQLTTSNDVQEIFVAKDGSLYLLHYNGNLSRLDESQPGSEGPKVIDNGTNTAHFFIAGNYLYLLKKDGAVWRVRNLPNPNPADFKKILDSQEGMGFREIYVIEREIEEEGDSEARILYLLNDQGELLQGTDTGGERITPIPIYPAPTQAYPTSTQGQAPD